MERHHLRWEEFGGGLAAFGVVVYVLIDQFYLNSLRKLRRNHPLF